MGAHELMPTISYVTALHVVDKHDGSSLCLDYLLRLAHDHQGHRGKMAKAAGVSEVTLWRYITHYREVHGNIAVMNLFKDTKEQS